MSTYNSVPRSEYPRPQFVRPDWISLNGEWDFESDYSVSGLERGLSDGRELPEKIIVPFCRESVLSGIGNTDFCSCVWYRRVVSVPSDWTLGRVILHIGACDFITDVYVNGKSAGHHVGGYISFEFDITKYLKGGENVIVIRAFDDVRSLNQPGGKQSVRYASHGCYYTRTTGIWQSVWLEHVPDSYIKNVKYYPNIEDSVISIEAVTENSDGLVLRAEAFFDDRAVGAAAATVIGNSCRLEMKLDELHLWDIGDGQLYGLRLSLGEDSLESYFGMRSIAVKNGTLILNGKPVFQRLVLDQGFYPDGIYTAPTQKELFLDIQRSLDMGFNGARLHEKIFEPEFLSECDRRGYIVWGEHANWSLDISRPNAYGAFLPEWSEAVMRDFNHPAIIGWCPLNETQRNQNSDFVRALVNLTKTLDPTRPCIDTSGWTHIRGLSDIVDLHCYEQDPEKFEDILAPLAEGQEIELYRGYSDHATFVSEYGGIRWSEKESGWGYGNAPQSKEEFIDRLTRLTKVLCDNPKISAFCYTQLTDVEQEVNGLYTYDRQPKFPPEIIKKAFTQEAVMDV